MALRVSHASHTLFNITSKTHDASIIFFGFGKGDFFRDKVVCSCAFDYAGRFWHVSATLNAG